MSRSLSLSLWRTTRSCRRPSLRPLATSLGTSPDLSLFAIKHLLTMARLTWETNGLVLKASSGDELVPPSGADTYFCSMNVACVFSQQSASLSCQ